MTLRLTLVALCALHTLPAQETVRDLDRPGEHSKHLTVDTVDRWILTAERDEVVRVDANSSEFDPVIQLVRLDDVDRIADVVVPEVDGEGSRSRLLARLPTHGRYAILVHGPEQRGGGNYRLFVERLRSVALPAGRESVEAFLDADGLAHVRFEAEDGETVVPHGAGVSELIDPRGHILDDWRGCYDVEHDGEHYVRVRGAAGAAFRVGVERGRRRAFGEGEQSAERTETLPAHGLDEWTFDAADGAFRTLLVDAERLEVRVTPLDEAAEGKGLDDRPSLRWLPAHSKGSAQRFAFVVGRDGRYRIQIRSAAPRPSEYSLRFGDTSERLTAGPPVSRELPVGGAQFFSFVAEPGQVLRLDVESEAFDPMLRLTDARGVEVGENDDGGTDLASRHGWLVNRRGLYRAQVASFGNGGGGGYDLTLTNVPVPGLPIGEARRGTVGASASEHWHIEGQAGATLLLSARSTTADMAISLFDPTGVAVGTDDDSGVDRDALLAVRLPRDGRYTVQVWSRSGRGDYTVQAIDPDGGQ